LHEHSVDALKVASSGRWSRAYDLETCKMFENFDSVLYEMPTNSPEVPDTYNMFRAGLALDLRADRQTGIVVPHCTDVERGLAEYVPMDLSNGYTHMGYFARLGGVASFTFRVPGTHKPLAIKAINTNRYHTNGLSQIVTRIMEVTEFPQTVIGICHEGTAKTDVPFTLNGYWMIDCSDHVFPARPEAT
jgi:hypothetical protein